MLASILATDQQAEANKTGLVQSQSTLDEQASLKIFNQMVSAAWTSLERSLKINRMGAVFQNKVANDEMNRINHRENIEDKQSMADHSNAVYLDCKQQFPEIKDLKTLNEKLKKRKERESLKMSALINKIDQ